MIYFYFHITYNLYTSFLKGEHYVQYFNYLDEINKRATVILEIGIVQKDGWEDVNYTIGAKFVIMLSNLLDIQYIRGFVVRINKTSQQVGIVVCVSPGKNTKCRWLSVDKRTLRLEKNIMDIDG